MPPRKPTTPAKARRKPATAERKTKPWRNRNRLELLPLEAHVERMILQRTPEPLIMAWATSQPGYADVTAEQLQGLIIGIRERWAAVQDDPGTVARARAEQAPMLDAAIHDAWHVPVFVQTPAGFQPLRNGDGTAVVKTDHKALAAYLKLRADFYGLKAPEKHLHLHGQVAPAAALSPAERDAEIQALLAKREAARLLPPGQVIDAIAADSPKGKK